MKFEQYLINRKKLISIIFSISNEQGISKVKLEDILYFESDLKTIYLQSWQQRYAFRGTISEVAEKLENLISYGCIKVM